MHNRQTHGLPEKQMPFVSDTCGWPTGGLEEQEHELTGDGVNGNTKGPASWPGPFASTG
jgi:hypothetical protein